MSSSWLKGGPWFFCNTLFLRTCDEVPSNHSIQKESGNLDKNTFSQFLKLLTRRACYQAIRIDKKPRQKTPTEKSTAGPLDVGASDARQTLGPCRFLAVWKLSWPCFSCWASRVLLPKGLCVRDVFFFHHFLGFWKAKPS